MAEVFGVVAGTAGILAFLTQITSGIDTLRDVMSCANKAPAELDSLINELKFLEHLMEEFIHKPLYADDYTLKMCHATCEHVVIGLEKLKKKLPVESIGTRMQKVKEIFVFRHWKEDVEVLQRSILDAKVTLTIMIVRGNSSGIEKILLAKQNHSPSPLISSLEGEVRTISSQPSTSAVYTTDESKVDSRAIAFARPPNFRNRLNCTENHCSCSCHYIARTTQRFWALEYTPLYMFGQPCDNASCNTTKYGGKFSFALSQLGFQWSAIIQFYILAAPGKFLFRPAFEIEQIVRYTSPGFETLWRCQNNEITVGEARDRLVQLYRSDPTFKNHVNPGGKSYIEELVRAPWGGPVNNSKQFALLELFMHEFEMRRGTESARFLIRCAKWIGEGPHLQLLEILLDLGFDATLIDSPCAQDWPQPSSPDWFAEDLAPDPFFVEYQSMLLRGNQGFAMISPLHEAVLLGPFESVKHWVPRSGKNERNFLGQTPVHFAVSNLKYLDVLIEAGHDLNSTDNYGITPLMYAAATNSQECLIALLEADANPYIRDGRYQRTFMQYAAIRGHWNLILESLHWLKANEKEEYAEFWAQHATILYFVVYPDYLQKREVSFQQILANCGSANFMIQDSRNESENNCLFHYVKCAKDVDVLLEHGFTLKNHMNSAGQHALFSAAIYQCEPDVFQRLLSAELEIDLRDNLHRTTLYYILDRLGSGSENTTKMAMDIACILLTNKADLQCGDKCRCPCSPDGCLASGVLDYSASTRRFSSAHVPVWSLEWLSLVLEHRGISEAKTILLSFIRKAKFDELGMTHVCCNRTRHQLWTLIFKKSVISDDDIDEILDEESDFIEILENEMTQSSTKPYETLLDEWIVQIKASLDKLCEKAMEDNKDLIRNTASSKSMYQLDHKNDSFRMNVTFNLRAGNPAREVAYDITQYICWMEYEYHLRSPSRLDVHKSTRDDCYLKRISWLYRLINILEISTQEMVDRMRRIWTLNAEREHSAINIEQGIEHFLLSWETCKVRQVSLVQG